VQVNHPELLASPKPCSQESRLNECGDVGARRGGGRKKDPQTWLANLDASKANCSKINLTAIAAFARTGPAAGAAGKSQEKNALRPLLRSSQIGERLLACSDNAPWQLTKFQVGDSPPGGGGGGAGDEAERGVRGVASA
jgi:hypothetical protein